MRTLLITFCASILLVLSPARAQEIPTPWQSTITIAAAAIASADTEALASLASSRSAAQAFDRDRTIALADLSRELAGTQVISCVAFDSLEKVNARTIMSDLGEAELPESVRATMVVDESRRDFADRTLRQWVSLALSPASDQRVAVIVFKREIESAPPELIFALVSAERRLDDSFVIHRVAYGSIEQALR